MCVCWGSGQQWEKVEAVYQIGIVSKGAEIFSLSENNDGDVALGCKEKAEPISQYKYMEL